MKTRINLNANQFTATAPARSRMRSKVELVSMLVLLMLSALVVQAQETSRQIPFTNLATTLPARSTQPLSVQLQDIGGAALFVEAHPEVSVDSKGRISFVFGALTGGGLDPTHFPSGSSRFIDVVDGTGASVLESGRIALTATAFALSPGPEGPQGPEGPVGPEGPAGPATVVSAGDSSILVGGTPSAPSIAVATNGINNSKVANGALSPGKISGTAATLGPNIFGANQNIIGTLSVTGAINSETQYNMKGSRVLSTPGVFNTFVGFAAGQDHTTGIQNSFFGLSAGQSNTTGNRNSFFGQGAGGSNITGNDNSFFGRFAGQSNASGSDNSFFGNEAGISNTLGRNNSFFGRNAGFSNTEGFNNDFFGRDAGRSNINGGDNSAFGGGAGRSNTSGIANSFFGRFAGQNHTTGFNNSFFGLDAGRSNTIESRNTFLGARSNGAPGITNATAIGADAVVTQSNSVVLGNNASVGIGTSAPKAKLQVQGGNIFVGSAGMGIILKSPNGAACRLLIINDAGVLVTPVVPCP